MYRLHPRESLRLCLTHYYGAFAMTYHTAGVIMHVAMSRLRLGDLRWWLLDTAPQLLILFLIERVFFTDSN
jgi:hypothetical protein